MAFTGKIFSLEEMKAERERLRKEGKKLVFTNGCFDILHLGHVTYLNWAREQGDALIVGVNSDASVKRNKGPKRPIVPEEDRAKLLLSLRCVDYVVIFDEDTPLRIIAELIPDILIKGRDWAGNVVGSDIVEANGGEVRLADLVAGRSTTGVIEKVIEVYGAPPVTSSEFGIFCQQCACATEMTQDGKGVEGKDRRP